MNDSSLGHRKQHHHRYLLQGSAGDYTIGSLPVCSGGNLAIRSDALDRYDLYETCVQSPGLLVPLLRAIYLGGREGKQGNGALVLGEDFCGSAALSRAWVSMVPDGRAVGVEIDPEPLARAATLCARTPEVTLIESDVMELAADSTTAADIVFVGNFSIGELLNREMLVQYMRGVHARLRVSSAMSGIGGVFVCDTYGGEHAYAIGDVDREHEGPNGERIIYRWEQRTADPLTARVTNALHFRVMVDNEVVQDVHDAFVYDWRLWSVPELRDAMHEAGFANTAVYAQLPDAVDDHGEAYVLPIEDAEDLGDDFIVCVAGRVGV